MYVGVDMTPEQAVLGCILSSGELIYEVTLQPYHFLVEKHRIIFSAMKELMAEDSAIDILLVTTKLVDKKLIEQVDGVSYLYNLTSSVATLANINHYEQLIFQAYREYAARELAARLNVNQLRFVKLIVDYVVKNGVMEKTVLQEEPFKSVGSIVELFRDNMQDARQIIGIIDLINRNSEEVTGA